MEGRRKGGGGRYITEQEVMGAKQEVMGDYKKDTGSEMITQCSSLLTVVVSFGNKP